MDVYTHVHVYLLLLWKVILLAIPLPPQVRLDIQEFNGDDDNRGIDGCSGGGDGHSKVGITILEPTGKQV